jgi:hypothetical protein
MILQCVVNAEDFILDQSWLANYMYKHCLGIHNYVASNYIQFTLFHTVPEDYDSDMDPDSTADDLEESRNNPADASWEDKLQYNTSQDTSHIPLDLSCTGEEMNNENSQGVSDETGSATDKSHDFCSQGDASWDGSNHGDALLDDDDSEEYREGEILAEPPNFICTICNLLFTDAGNIRSHMHEEGYSFKCLYDDCDKVFDSINKLRRHRKYHMVRKRYVCKVLGCMATFAFPYLMRRHIREVHDVNRQREKNLASRAISCTHDGCGKLFAFEATMERHMKSVHKNRHHDMGCAVEGCDRRFMYYTTAKRHMREIHGVEDPPEPLQLDVDSPDHKMTDNLQESQPQPMDNTDWDTSGGHPEALQPQGSPLESQRPVEETLEPQDLPEDELSDATIDYNGM